MIHGGHKIRFRSPTVRFHPSDTLPPNHLDHRTASPIVHRKENILLSPRETLPPDENRGRLPPPTISGHLSSRPPPASETEYPIIPCPEHPAVSAWLCSMRCLRIDLLFA
jgi:hypothetical protein